MQKNLLDAGCALIVSLTDVGVLVGVLVGVDVGV